MRPVGQLVAVWAEERRFLPSFSVCCGDEGFFMSAAGLEHMQTIRRKKAAFQQISKDMHRHTLLLAVAAFGAAQTNFSQAQPDLFADRVASYEPGTGFAGEGSSGLEYTNANSALGLPSAETPGEFGGLVTPFAPPFLREQLLSIGAGGHLILEFDPPIFNHPANPFGIDLILYGSAGFNITNGNFSGGGITDGSLFGQAVGDASRLSASADGATWHLLDESLAPVADGLFPSDGKGRFGVPVNPSLRPADFAGADLSQIRQLYRNSAGGTGYDLDWAQDADGRPLSWARFIRIDVLRGKVEIDGASGVLPAGGTAPLRFAETFAKDPASHGWETTGESSLFQWDESAERLAAQWDSSQPNSYFHRPLGLTLNTQQNFSISFDLELDSIEIGTTLDKPFTFPIAIGLIDLAQATRTDFFRGSGVHSSHGHRGAVEWNYLPDSGFGATISTGLISQDNQWAFQNTFPLALETQTLYQVRMEYDAANGKLETTMTADGEPFGPIQDALLSEIFLNPLENGFTRLNVNTISISSYSDAGQSPPEYAGSIQAAGYVDNIVVEATAAVSAVPIRQIQQTGDTLQIAFDSSAGKDYWLERTADFLDWITISHQRTEETGESVFSISIDEFSLGFFRIRAAQ